MCRWDDGTEHVCEILDQRPIEEEGTTSYYVHYVDFDRRLDDWVKEERMSDAPAEGDRMASCKPPPAPTVPRATKRRR